MDERIKTLAYNLVHFSCKLEKGEKVWISWQRRASAAAGEADYQGDLQGGCDSLCKNDDKLSGTGAASGRNRGTAENHGRGGLPPDGADGCLHRCAWRGQPDGAV